MSRKLTACAKANTSCVRFQHLVKSTLATRQSVTSGQSDSPQMAGQKWSVVKPQRELEGQPTCVPLCINQARSRVLSNNPCLSARELFQPTIKPKPQRSVERTLRGFLRQIKFPTGQGRILAMSDGSDCSPARQNRQAECGTFVKLGNCFSGCLIISFAKFSECGNTLKSGLIGGAAKDTNARCLRGLLTSLSGTTNRSLFTVRHAYTRIPAHTQYLHAAIWQKARGTLARGPPVSVPCDHLDFM